MIETVLLVLPFALAVVALALPSDRWRPLILPIGGGAYLGLAMAVLFAPSRTIAGGWLALDPLGRLFMLLVGILFLSSSVYAFGYLRYERRLPNRVFCACMLAFLGSMNVLVWSQHWGLIWVAMEATTLASAPLIYFHRTSRSLEATWKYLLICSVAIAVALLGSFFLAYASLHSRLRPSLLVTDLLAAAPLLDRPWLHAAFALLVVGYGTKMGLAPLHAWLPDAHGEAPAPISAVLSGALLPCALLPILRAYQLCVAAGDALFAQRILVVLGLVSMAVSGVFLAGQRDLKRMLAYSSIEQMGILAFAIGIGQAATLGALLHMFNSSLAKSVLFLGSGNVYHAYGSKSVPEVSGVLARLPRTGPLLLAGFFAISGAPPFGTFMSTLTILSGVFGGGWFFAGGLFLVLLLLVFVGMGATVLSAVQGRPSPKAAASGYRDTVITWGPMAAMLALLVWLGLAVPPGLSNLLHAAARLLEVE